MLYLYTNIVLVKVYRIIPSISSTIVLAPLAWLSKETEQKKVNRDGLFSKIKRLYCQKYSGHICFVISDCVQGDFSKRSNDKFCRYRVPCRGNPSDQVLSRWLSELSTWQSLVCLSQPFAPQNSNCLLK